MKNKFGRVLQILVAVMLVSAVFVSSMLGTVNADYFKSLSQKLKFEATPDLAFSYYIKDASHTSGAQGTYKNTKNISQAIKTTSTVTGANVIYEIMLPNVDSGVYTLDFTVEFVMNGDSSADFYVPADAISTKTTVVSLNKPVGCKVIKTIKDANGNVTFTKSVTTLLTDDQAKEPFNKVQRYYVTDNYQWKTLAPSRSENVSLTFTTDGTQNMMLAWDLRGLPTGNFELKLTDISINRVTAPESDEPYFDFPNMYCVNNALFPSDDAQANEDVIPHTTGNTYLLSVRNRNGVVNGKLEPGKTRQSQARGTYVTEATYNSMTMQAEVLEFGYEGSEEISARYAEQDWGISDSSINLRYSNVISFGVPIKNIKTETTYKVTFDFSVARQGGDGTGEGLNEDVEDLTPEQRAAYQNGDNIFRDKANGKTGDTSHFQSYLYKRSDTTYSVAAATHDTYGRGNVFLNDKAFYHNELAPDVLAANNKGAFLTRYDEIVKGSVDKISQSTVDSVNDYAKSGNYNWLNAVSHTEYNGENTITWVTFKNTTFSFNIADKFTTNTELANLQWVWAIDAFEPKQWYRIKIDNLRIEEVVQYGSNIDNGSLFIGGVNANYNNGDSVYMYRGSNGTGQNHQGRGYTTIPLAKMNPYAPVYDAKDIFDPIASTLPSNKQVSFSGYAACLGGVDRFVWSADGGASWNEMNSQTLSDPSENELKQAAACAENSTSGRAAPTLGTLPRYISKANVIEYKREYVNFTEADGKNGKFSIMFDLAGTKYENQPELDIIVAAVPLQNINLRCEIFRIFNFNPIVHYVSQIDYIASDLADNSANSNRTFLPNNFVVARDSNKSDSLIPMTKEVGRKQQTGKETVCPDEGVYFHRRDNTVFAGYENIRTLYNGIPIKTTLTVAGRAVMSGGIQEYAYSVDGGLTWNTIEHTPTHYNKSANLANSNFDTCGTIHEKLAYVWLLKNILSNVTQYRLDGKTNNGLFDTTAPLKINLSAYAGQTIDVIVGAKSSTGAYCPIAKLDNVAVYGDASTDAPSDRGAFITVIDSISVNDTAITRIDTDLGGNYMYKAGWNFASFGDPERIISAIEPYHTNILNTRMYTNEVQNVKVDDTVKIEGFTICKNGVNRYLFTLDGGKTWQPITDAVYINLTDSLMANGGGAIDTTLGANDKTNGVYRSRDGARGYLSIKIPEGQEIDSEKYLLIVAESNANTDVNGDGSLNDPSGKYYPVSQIKIKIVA